MTRLALPIHSYVLRSRPASPSRLVNAFAELMPPGGKTPVLIRRSPGIKAWTTVGSGPIHALYTASIEFDSGRLDRLYVVSGSEVYSVDADKNATLLGDIGAAVRIDMASNVDNLVIVNEPKAYFYDGAAFGEITDEDFTSRGAADVEFLNNFLLFREPNSARFFSPSAAGETLTYNALMFAIADSQPDNMNGMIADHGQLICFGTETTELFEIQEIPGFPFQRNINGEIEQGCLNSKTVAPLDNSVYWVAEDFTVRRLEGITPVRVSTNAVEQSIAAATTSSAEAFAYDQEGHFFYVLSFDEVTWVLDVSTGEWHERQSYLKSNWAIRGHAQFNGLELIGDRNSNKVGQLSTTTFADWGVTQRMEWTYQPVYAEGVRAFHDRLEIVLETGIGLTTGQGSDPKIMLQYSDDGGETWTSMPDKSLGKLGKRLTRAVWFNLGSSRQRVYRAAVSDPIEVVVTDTILEVRGGKL